MEDHVRGSIETNRWYDIRVELHDGGVKAYLDGKLIHESDRKPMSTLYAAAGRDRRAGELVLQLVNPFDDPMSVTVKLDGAGKLGATARTITLAAADPDVENTLDRPDALAPRTGKLGGIAPVFGCSLEPHSLTTVRIPEK